MPTCAPRKATSFVSRLSAPTHHHGQPLVHGDPADLQRVGHIHEVVLAGADHFKQLLRPGHEPLFVPGRQDDRHGRWRASCDRRARVRVFLDHQMSVGATRAKGGNASASGVLRIADSWPFPRCQRALDDEGAVLEVDLGIGVLRMQGRHQLAVLELQQDLRQTGDARGALAVANVRFHRADGAKLVVVALSGILLIHLMESPYDSRYPTGSPRAVPVPWASR